MQFKEDAKVLTLDGRKAGHVDRVVLDPATREITHLVVRKGFLFSEDKVVPVEFVQSATEEQVVLKGIEDLEALPDFEEPHYVEAESAEPDGAYPPGSVRPYYWYPPPYVTWWGATPYPISPVPPYVIGVRRNIPEGTVPLKEGASVITSDDEKVGEIERIYADPTHDRATHLLISKGLLLKEKRVVPTAWISRVAEDQVHLAVSSELINSLPEYEEES